MTYAACDIFTQKILNFFSYSSLHFDVCLKWLLWNLSPETLLSQLDIHIYVSFSFNTFCLFVVKSMGKRNEKEKSENKESVSHLVVQWLNNIIWPEICEM